MNWRNPKVELPEDDQLVFVLVEPHKWRGSLSESAMSVQIVAGWVSHRHDGVFVNNDDELGMGSIGWYLSGNCKYEHENALAWLPVHEMPLPKWSA